MKILIIEDDENKLNDILRILDGNNIDVSMSYNSGLRKAVKNNYDLLILDNNFPMFENEGIVEDNGLMFIEDLKFRNINLKTVIVSSKDNPDSGTEWIHYDPTSNAYIKAIESLL